MGKDSDSTKPFASPVPNQKNIVWISYYNCFSQHKGSEPINLQVIF